jgi:hypothetical protein
MALSNAPLQAKNLFPIAIKGRQQSDHAKQANKNTGGDPLQALGDLTRQHELGRRIRILPYSFAVFLGTLMLQAVCAPRRLG